MQFATPVSMHQMVEQTRYDTGSMCAACGCDIGQHLMVANGSSTVIGCCAKGVTEYCNMEYDEYGWRFRCECYGGEASMRASIGVAFDVETRDDARKRTGQKPVTK